MVDRALSASSFKNILKLEMRRIPDPMSVSTKLLFFDTKSFLARSPDSTDPNDLDYDDDHWIGDGAVHAAPAGLASGIVLYLYISTKVLF